MRRLLLILALCAPALSAQAQDRSPALRQTLVDLAYVLGEAHALRQVCTGAEDQFWRTRMIRMVDVEQPDAALDRRLKESFNTGFASRQSEFATCGAGSRRAEAAATARGRDIALKLSQVMNRVTDGEMPPTVMDQASGVAAHPTAR